MRVSEGELFSFASFAENRREADKKPQQIRQLRSFAQLRPL
jgi:hypothetical protein